MAKVKLTEVRLSFPSLFNAEQYEGQGPFNYRAQFLFAPNSANHKAVANAISEAAKEKWKDKAKSILDAIKTQPQKYCLTDGNTKEYDGYKGMMALSASRKKESGRPLVIDRDKTPLNEEDGKPYAGCYVNATVEIWIQENKWGKGVRAQLLAVQFLKDGDAFSAGAFGSPDEFEDLSTESETTEESLV